MRVIQHVTPISCFSRAKMAANFGLNCQNGMAEITIFAYRMRKKMLAVFPSIRKVQTLLLSKHLTKENFVSVAL